jgi:hypothetical protein
MTTVTKKGLHLDDIINSLDERFINQNNIAARQKEGKEWVVTYNDPRRFFIGASCHKTYKEFCDNNGLKHAECTHLTSVDKIMGLDPDKAVILFDTSFERAPHDLQKSVWEVAESRGFFA